jgi:hypothetical protein
MWTSGNNFFCHTHSELHIIMLAFETKTRFQLFAGFQYNFLLFQSKETLVRFKIRTNVCYFFLPHHQNFLQQPTQKTWLFPS